jgi:hypothetical protein
MSDLITAFLITFAFIPVAILVNRLQLILWPSKKVQPGQGTIARSAFLAMLLLLSGGAFVLGDSVASKGMWLLFLVIILGSALMVYVSIMCVSESGRRFYFMALIEKAGGLSQDELQAAYGKEHMLTIRLQRLVSWGVLNFDSSSYRLLSPLAYAYSRLFQVWGRLIGFHWF